METALPHQLVAGRYVLQERIGSGGMATVWRADDRVLARAVAVKLLREDLASDPAFLERFQREAVSAARLTHPNIVSVFDAGMDGELSFIVMEHVTGETLRRLLDRRGPLDPSDAVRVMLPVLAALGCAHAAGIVHRDLKPENVLLGSGGRVKVADFGLAKASHGEPITTESIVGTARYLSPEQVEGAEVTPASDVYAAGIVLHELLTGRTPFEAETDLTTAMLRLVRDPMPPSAVRGGIPRDLDRIVCKALARHPQERYPTAWGMRAALDRFAGNEPPPTSATRPGRAPASPRRTQPSALRSWMMVPLAVLLAAAFLIIAGLGLGRLEIGGPLGLRAAPKTAESAKVAGGPVHALSIASASSYDPLPGDGSEHSESAGQAIDGNPQTAWTTDHYASAAFGNLKTGVGLWLALGGPQQVRAVTVRSSVPGWSFRLFGGGAPSVAGSPLAATSGQTTFTIPASGTLSFTIRPARTRGLLVWITGLAPDAGRFEADIGEISLRGVSP